MGKTAIATGLARGIKAVHLRIDSIEQVCAREYEPWQANIVIDTTGQHIEASVSALLERLEGFGQALQATGDTGK